MNKLFIPVILGTGRHGRKSDHVAAVAFEIMKRKTDVETEYVDIEKYVTCITNPPEEPNPKGASWKELAAKSDGFLIISPEYNHSYPGELKMVLDEAFREYFKKPAAFISTSSGMIAGARVVEMLRLLSVSLGMVPTYATANFPKVQELFGADGALLDPSYGKKVEKVIDELIWFTRLLKEGREKLRAETQ